VRDIGSCQPLFLSFIVLVDEEVLSYV